MSQPWMPLYIGDYLADTAHLRAAEHGAYLLLIMHYWRTGGLPDDDQLLARIARMSSAEWQRARPVIAALFAEGWKHKRIEFELTEAARISAAGRKGGQASGAARRAKSQRSTNDSPTIDERSFNDPGNDPPTNREALQSQSQVSKPKKVSRPRGEPLPVDWKPDRDFARSKGFSEQQIDEQEQRFRDHAAANRRLQADWPAAWRNWITSPYQRAGPVNGHGAAPRPGSREDRQERLANVLQSIDPRTRPHADDDRRGQGAAAPVAGLLPFGRRD